MPADRLLGTLLRSLQTYTDQQDTPRVLATAASLLTTLTNPLNVTLLTTQLLTAPAIWDRPDGLRTCLRFMGVFHSAGLTILNHEVAKLNGEAQPALPGQVPLSGGLSPEEWVRAIAKGADERSQRWKHMTVLGGLLLGLQTQDEPGLFKSIHAKLEEGLVQATNLALDEARNGDELGAHCVALVLNHTFPVLSDHVRAQLDYDRLLPVLVGTAFFSSEGFQSGYFLGAVDLDVVHMPGGKLNWPPHATSYQQIQRILSRPLVSSMGPLSRLTSHAVENVKDPWLIQTLMDDLAGFARALTTQWRVNKLSEVDASEEDRVLHHDAREKTLPSLWKLLKTALFATVIVLRSATGRILGDPVLASDGVAPIIVTQALHTLRNLYFISSRLGANSFSQYTFVYLTALDILTRYPAQADAFLQAIRPTQLGHIPSRPLDRCLDLYFLNTAEHFTLALSPQTNESLLLAAAAPYLSAADNGTLLPIFEAAHSVVLAVLCAPQNAELAARYLPFYVDALFAVFPHNLSPRQFRLAFKTLLRITAPPSELAAAQPDISGTLLELVRHRALQASSAPLKLDTAPVTAAAEPVDAVPQPPLSEQAVLTLTLLDALPFLPPDALDEWLPLSAELVNAIADEEMRRVCRARFWEVMVSGEMGPESALRCVAWWGSRGGREMVERGRGDREEVMMSGALPGGARESKL
ncbi:hypothetical protein W97_07586 [Coniosporium apollinis CBS 100218]|uniref:Peroxisomal membrane protein Pex17 n=1 Tax=Coniosporium apollinis (strain CBS 100218) TaxID=1168221 RepID=R7Z2K1_CONA1|nr:uncharacterized protein W97_07586 [Coniosporium apollinis CBS 100218]EON68328.1 hypothetical protein W97_07586 [Coniosporium apollinis CBS 100218]